MDHSRDAPNLDLDAQVMLWWLPAYTLWWEPVLMGAPNQVGAALEELATRVTRDSAARRAMLADPFTAIRYRLVVSVHGTMSAGLILCSHHDFVLLGSLPDRLRAHAQAIRRIGPDTG